MRPILLLLLLFAAKIVTAQSCSGSLGDPIVNITFGAGEGVGDPLPGELTANLGYKYADCPNDGQYVIINESDTCFGSKWHHVTDHTGDTNGYYMLVNATYEPSVFYVETINGLCTGTTFRFAVWIVNMSNYTSSIKPNITMTIEKTDGTILSSYNTGDIDINITAPEWKEYGMNFSTPAGVSTVVLRMRNNAPGGYGNDVGLDDITFRSIGPAISVFAADIPEDTTLVCENDSKSITLESKIESCYANTAYQWQVSTNNGDSWDDIPGATTQTFTREPTPAGTYLYRLAAAQQNNIGVSTCQTASKPFTILVYSPDVRTISISKSTAVICENNSVTFRANTTYAGKSPRFQWMLNDQQVGTNDSVFTTSALKTGDVMSCIFTSSLACNSPATANAGAVSVLKKSYTTVNAAICEGESYDGHATQGTFSDVFLGSNGCDSTRTLNLVVYPKQYSQLDTTICFGTSYRGLTADGTYNFVYPDIHGCDSTHTIILHVQPNIYAKPYSDTILCSGDSLVLNTHNIPFDTYLWQDGSAGSVFNVRKGGTYRVTASNKCGTATQTTFVDEKLCNIDFPTAFTPNRDGKNDKFRVVNAYALTYFRFVVLNRWGQKVFETADPLQGWDGNVNARPADRGTYIWFCEYMRTGLPAPVQRKGTVILMR